MLQNAAACQISGAPRKVKTWQLIINIYNFHIQYFPKRWRWRIFSIFLALHC